ncbi:hypothetical protein BV20DRAFT_525992 [Pilatotrama ljubarskyi]|nr:hypothetical protein BV20DRAFT_525992 [Pilatotrama ljubarskyi]
MAAEAGVAVLVVFRTKHTFGYRGALRMYRCAAVSWLRHLLSSPVSSTGTPAIPSERMSVSVNLVGAVSGQGSSSLTAKGLSHVLADDDRLHPDCPWHAELTLGLPSVASRSTHGKRVLCPDGVASALLPICRAVRSLTTMISEDYNYGSKCSCVNLVSISTSKDIPLAMTLVYASESAESRLIKHIAARDSLLGLWTYSIAEALS